MLKKNQDGFSLIEGLLIVIALCLVVLTGIYVMDARDKDEPKKSDSTSKQEKQADPTANWESYSNDDYSLRYPANWVTATNPELCSEGIFLVGPTEETVGKCGSDGAGIISFGTFTTESGPMGLDEASYDRLETKDVTVDGVSGTRYAGVFAGSEEGLGPEAGTKTVKYVFKTNGTYFSALYSQASGDPDVLKDFDQIVLKTLKFN